MASQPPSALPLTLSQTPQSVNCSVATAKQSSFVEPFSVFPFPLRRTSAARCRAAPSARRRHSLTHNGSWPGARRAVHDRRGRGRLEDHRHRPRGRMVPPLPEHTLPHSIAGCLPSFPAFLQNYSLTHSFSSGPSPRSVPSLDPRPPCFISCHFASLHLLPLRFFSSLSSSLLCISLLL
jgi:hypothetical protein